MYEVGLGESPMQIAGKLTGDRGRYRELLAANPHKSLVYVGGAPTFASLGVGERIAVPDAWGLGALPSLPSFSSGDASLLHDALPSGAQQQLQSYVSKYSPTEAETKGAEAMMSIASGHPDSGAIVHAWSGAVASVPVVGTAMAAIAEFVYANRQAIGDFFNNLGQQLGISGCHPQNKSLAEWQSVAQIPHQTPGTLGSVLVPVLLQAWQDLAECQVNRHGMDFSKWETQIVPAMVALWNKQAPGPPIDYFVPLMYGRAAGYLLCPNQGNMLCFPSQQGPWAFQPLDRVPSSARVLAEGMGWFRVRANAGPLAAPKKAASAAQPQPTPAAHPAKVIQLKAPHAPAPPSHPAKVVQLTATRPSATSPATPSAPATPAAPSAAAAAPTPAGAYGPYPA